jgi:hypothetical protein
MALYLKIVKYLINLFYLHILGIRGAATMLGEMDPQWDTQFFIYRFSNYKNWL